MIKTKNIASNTPTEAYENHFFLPHNTESESMVIRPIDSCQSTPTADDLNTMPNHLTTMQKIEPVCTTGAGVIHAK